MNQVPLRTPVVLVVLALLGWLVLDRSAGQPGPAPADGTPRAGQSVAASPQAGEPLSSRADVAVADAPTRADVGEAVPGADVAVLVRVLWPDRSPAAGVTVSLRSAVRGLPRTVLEQGRSDEDGALRFEGIVPGTYRVRADRGKDQEFKVADSPALQEVELVLEAGVTVRGTVVDAEDRPAARARIWLQTQFSDWSGGAVIGTADDAGRFELMGIPADLSLGALAADGAFGSPSELVDLDVCDIVDGQAEIRLVLGSIGGRVVGTVRDAVSGEPIEGAVVALGAKNTRMDVRGDRVIENWGPQTVRTGSDGRFALDGVRQGEVAWSARARTHGIRRGTAQVAAGETAALDILLEPSATLVGFVTDDSGAARRGVVVHAFDRTPGTDYIQTGQIDFDEVLGHVATRTDAKGRYRLEGVTPGVVHAIVQPVRGGWGDGTGQPFVQEELALQPGQERDWSPVLSDGRVIEGRALYRDGHPLEMQFVTLRDAGGTSRGTLTTDREGRFRFVCLTEPIYSVYVQVFDQPRGSPPVQATGVVPGQGPVEIRATFDRPVELEPAHVTGRVVDLGGRIPQPKAATVLLIQPDNSWRTERLDDEGRFTFPEVEPGLIRLVVMDGEVAVFHGEPFTVEPAARHDVGALTTSPERAELQVRLRRGAGAEDVELSLYLRRADGRRGATAAPVPGDDFVLANMMPGDFDWSLYGKGVVGAKGRIALASDAPTVLDIDVVAGARCKCDVRFADDTDLGEVSVVYMREGVEFHRAEYKPGSAVDFRRYYVGATLPPGEYAIHLTTTTGLRASATVSVGPSLDPVEPVLQLR